MIIVKSVQVRQNHLKSAFESKGSQIVQQNEILKLACGCLQKFLKFQSSFIERFIDKRLMKN